jgi:hypothetical protein
MRMQLQGVLSVVGLRLSIVITTARRAAFLSVISISVSFVIISGGILDAIIRRRESTTQTKAAYRKLANIFGDDLLPQKCGTFISNDHRTRTPD